MSSDVSYRILLQDEFSKKAAEVKRSVEAMSKSFDALSAGGSVGMRKVGMGLGGLATRAAMMGGFGKSMMTHVTAPLLAAAGASLHAYQKFQTLEIGFSAMMHSAKKGHQMMVMLKDFASRGVFTASDVMTAGSQLITAGVPASQVKEDLKMLGDIAAGTGRRISDVASMYTRVKMIGHAYFIDFRMAGINQIDLLKQMSKGLGVTTQDVARYASQGLITFDMYRNALKSMTNKNGIFFNQIYLHLHTMLGATNKLKENLELTAGAFGAQLDEQYKVTDNLLRYSEMLKRVYDDMPGFIARHKTLISTLATLAKFLVVIGPILYGMSLIIKGITTVITTISMLKKAFIAIRAAALVMSGPIGWLIGALSLLAWGFYELATSSTREGARIRRHLQAIVDAVKATAQFIMHPIQSIEEAFGRMADRIRSAYKTVVDSMHKLYSLGAKATGAVSGAVMGGVHRIENVFSSPVSPTFPGRQLGAPQAQQQSKAELHIKVDDKAGTIKSMHLKSKGIMGFDLGQNMSPIFEGAY